jgi:hypothetical protein
MLARSWVVRHIHVHSWRSHSGMCMRMHLRAFDYANHESVRVVAVRIQMQFRRRVVVVDGCRYCLSACICSLYACLCLRLCLCSRSICLTLLMLKHGSAVPRGNVDVHKPLTGCHPELRVLNRMREHRRLRSRLRLCSCSCWRYAYAYVYASL